MDIYVRMNILLENKVITKEVYSKVDKLICELKDKFNIEITEENGAMFITHLSAALTRINDGKAVDVIDESIMDQLKLDKRYSISLKIMDLINHTCDIVFPREEEVFILTYLCTILN